MTIDHFCNNILPSGSGFNCKWEHVKEQVNGAHVFETYYHNMNEHGYYDGYTKIRLTITKIITDFRITLIGKAKYTDYDMRDYLTDCISNALQGLAFNWDIEEV